ncbi:MAG: glutathione S-transferase [Solirubrobacteraceae bacterium]|nr:glutathione S-transferase [Solirubrobacteraceae bacterium]
MSPDPAHLVLHQHPFASFCQKPLIALYELGLSFQAPIVADEASRRALEELSPLGKMPVLRVEPEDLTLPESTTIVEYVDRLTADRPRLVPDDPAAALQARLWDRIFDAYVQLPMQKIVADALRPEGRGDAEGVADARRTLDTAYGVIEAKAAGGRWITGDAFTLADCAAAPALFYAHVVHPWDEEERPHLTRYYRDLMHRPSVARTIDEAKPYRELFPLPWPPHADDHRPPAADSAG